MVYALVGDMHVAELWRFPVKSLRGERLAEAELLAGGIPGDRVVHVRTRDGRVVTSRIRPHLLSLAGTLGPDGEPLIDGRSWRDPASLQAVREATGADVLLGRYEELDRFDVLPLCIATDGAIAALDIDGRRLRPNIVVGGVDGLAEREWPGRRLRIGSAVIEVVKLRARCVMTTFDPDTIEQDRSVLQRIVDVFDGRTALDCRVETPGLAAIGDPVELLR
jgi:uncharacterized protein YcbX